MYRSVQRIRRWHFAKRKLSLVGDTSEERAVMLLLQAVICVLVTLQPCSSTIFLSLTHVLCFMWQNIRLLGGFYSSSYLEIDCGPPPNIAHGIMVANSGTTCGKNVSYVCEEGYYFNSGNPTENITCLESGLWTVTFCSSKYLPTCYLVKWDFLWFNQSWRCRGHILTQSPTIRLKILQWSLMFEENHLTQFR